MLIPIGLLPALTAIAASAPAPPTCRPAPELEALEHFSEVATLRAGPGDIELEPYAALVRIEAPSAEEELVLGAIKLKSAGFVAWTRGSTVLIALSSYRDRAARWRRDRVVFGRARALGARRARWMGASCAAELPAFSSAELARGWADLCAGVPLGEASAGAIARALTKPSEAIWFEMLHAESDALSAIAWDELARRAEADPVARRHLALARALWHAERDELIAALRHARSSYYLGRRSSYRSSAAVDAFIERLGRGLITRAFLAELQAERPARALALLDDFETFSATPPPWLARQIAAAARAADQAERARRIYEELIADPALGEDAKRELAGELAAAYLEEGDAVRARAVARWALERFGPEQVRADFFGERGAGSDKPAALWIEPRHGFAWSVPTASRIRSIEASEAPQHPRP